MARRSLTKQQMIFELQRLRETGWIESRRPLNSGGIGNTIDHLLGVLENNLPIADTAQWELKTHRIGNPSLITLFHMEPYPKGSIPRLLLPIYGWPDHLGRQSELSFRQTLNSSRLTDRGFSIDLHRPTQRIVVTFTSNRVGAHHESWLASVNDRGGLILNPQPYWEIQEVALKASTKMLNTFYIEATPQKAGNRELFRIDNIMVLQGFSTDGFMDAIEEGQVYIDFDARTHHNHGTKFRLKEEALPKLYKYVEKH